MENEIFLSVLSKGIFNELKEVLRLTSASNALTVINKIVFTSQEAMVEFSGEKLTPLRSSKPFIHMQIYIRLNGQIRDSKT